MAIPRQLFSRVRVSLTRCAVSDTALLVRFLYDVELASYLVPLGWQKTSVRSAKLSRGENDEA